MPYVRLDDHSGPVLLWAGSEPLGAARIAEQAAALLADRPVVVLATWEAPPMSSGLDSVIDALHDEHADLRSAVRRSGEDAAIAACKVLDTHGMHVDGRAQPTERAPTRAVLQVADEIGAGLVVAAAHAGTEHRWGWLGADARALARRTHRPLLLLAEGRAPADADAPAIFASDGSARAEHAIRAAAGLLRHRPAIAATAWQTASSVVGVALLAVPDEVAREGAHGLDAVSRRDAERHAGDGAAELAQAGWPCEARAIETSGNVAAAIVAAADEQEAAIVVTGTRGRSRVAAALLGSSAEAILRHAERPVLVVPPPAHLSIV